MKKLGTLFLISAGVIVLFLGWTKPALAHCDTMAGPVATEAMAALQKGQVEPLLKWVRKEDEGDVEKVFNKTLKARKGSAEGREVADLYFIETLVRLHRTSEGEPFTGVKPAGTPLDPGIQEADEALAKGSVEVLAGDLGKKVTQAVQAKFHRVLEAKKHSGENVAKGREYVAAYVDFMHTVEHLHHLLAGNKLAEGHAGEE